jgi:hypothetical protein
MTPSELEEAVFEYGAMNYTIGRMETDGKDTMKKYTKLVEDRDKMREKILNHFKRK